MKKNVFLKVFAAIAVLAIVSCEKNDDDPKPDQVDTQLGGMEITTEITLDATEAYELDGACLVKAGGVLNIPAGTIITAKGNTTSYLLVEQGGKIVANGTEAEPIVFTSTVKEAGSWGGLVLCGNAPCNKQGASEVGNSPYGGTVADDNSGILKYVRVEYTGYSFTDEKQFNGISFFGVGSGTQVSYISSYKGLDDGIEFFGGTVNADHVVSIESGDDGIDFADGWNGTGSYWYAYNSTKSGVEGSNNGSNPEATPMTNATLSNLTIYKMGEKPWFFKEGGGSQNITNIIIGGLSASKDHAIFYAGGDPIYGTQTVTGAKFVDQVANQADTDVAGLTIGADANATGAGDYTDATTYEPNWASSWAKGN